MTFVQYIASIPYDATSSQATGLFAPIMRASGHILYCLAASSDEGNYVITNDEAQRELEHATVHLASTIEIADKAPISTLCKTYIQSFCEAVLAASIEWGEWTIPQRSTNLKDLADRAAALGAFFDKEFAGIRDSNPGFTL